MSSYVLPFRNPNNFAKCQLFNYEVGTNTIILVLEWLYVGPKPMEKHFVVLTRNKSYNFNSSEKDELQNLSKNKIKIGDLDLSLLYKISKIVCGLLPQDNIVWSRKCPKFRQSELEHCLFKLKDGRNKLAHPSDQVKNIADSDVEEVCEEMKQLVTLILRMAGERAGIDTNVIDNEVTRTQDSLERICLGEIISGNMKTHLKNIILNDLKTTYEEELKSSFSKELRGYSIPNLRREDKIKSIILNLNEILKVGDSPGIVVFGEAGSGKTAMTRFLFYSWLSGNTSYIHGLSSFDIVLKVECGCLYSSDVSEFLEEHFKTASYSFSNTTSLMKQLNQFNVLWIMDGFDESTTEFKGFLKTVLRRLPTEHKVIITSRLNSNEDLLNFLSKIETVTLYLELLTDSNTNEIINNLIIDEEKRKSFADKFSLFNDTVKAELTTPLNMVMYIELWLDDPDQDVETYNIMNLYLKTTKIQMRRLEEKLFLHTSYSTADLKLFLDSWFYGCLCKQSFLLVCEGKWYIDNGTENILKIEATKVKLTCSFCLSAFLSEVQGNEKYARFNFKHITQAFFFSSLFLKKRETYQDFSMKEIYLKGKIMFYRVDGVLENFIQMIAEESTLNPNSKTDVYNVKPLVSLYDEPTQGYLWFAISCNCNFKNHIMKKISSLINNCLHLDNRITGHHAFPFKFYKFLSQIDLNELVIHTSLGFSIEEYVMEILHYLKGRNCKIKIIKSRQIEELEEKMAIVEEHYWNRMENATHQWLYFEAATNVFVKILQWFYKVEKPIENQMVSLSEDCTNILNSLERNGLEKLAKGQGNLAEMGIPFLVKVARLLTGTKHTIQHADNYVKWTEDKYSDPLQYLLRELNQVPNPSLKTMFTEAISIEDSDKEYFQSTALLTTEELLTSIPGNKILSQEHYIEINSEDCGTSTQKITTVEDNRITVEDNRITVEDNRITVEDNQKTVEDDSYSDNSLDEITYHLLMSKLVQLYWCNDAFKVESPKLSFITEKAEELKKIQRSIITEVGHKAGIDLEEIEVAISDFNQNISDIIGGKNLAMLFTNYAKQIIFRDISEAFENNYKLIDFNEMKSYSAPRLKIIKLNSTSRTDQLYAKVPYFEVLDDTHNATELTNILTCNAEARVILVTGMAGTGKSAFTRYLYNTWVHGDRDAVAGLQTFDIVIRVECSHLKSRFVSRLLENLFPKSSNIFPSIWHLKKYLDTFNILWILENADGCPRMYKRLLYSITRQFPANHKFIYTAMEYSIIFVVFKVDSVFRLQLLSDDNVEEISAKLITEEDEHKRFMKDFDSLNSSAKSLLKLPINLISFIDFWNDDPCLMVDCESSDALLKKLTKLCHKRFKDSNIEIELCYNFQSYEEMMKCLDEGDDRIFLPQIQQTFFSIYFIKNYPQI